MRGLFRRCLIGLLALLFAASGVFARQCAAAHHSSRAGEIAIVKIDAGHHAHVPPHAAHGHLDDGATDHQHASNDVAPMAVDDRACNKCCSTCTLVVAMAPDGGASAIFTVSPASFFSSTGHCCDTTLPVDPGIPKRIL